MNWFVDNERDAILREAMDQYVENLRDYVESEDNVPHAEKVKLDLAIEMLDEMNEAFLARVGAL